MKNQKHVYVDTFCVCMVSCDVNCSCFEVRLATLYWPALLYMYSLWPPYINRTYTCTIHVGTFGVAKSLVLSS